MMFTQKDMQIMASALAVLGTIFDEDIEVIRDIKKQFRQGSGTELTSEAVENTLLKLTMTVMEARMEAVQEAVKEQGGPAEFLRNMLSQAERDEQGGGGLEELRRKIRSAFEES